jgi:hypothetical protein
LILSTGWARLGRFSLASPRLSGDFSLGMGDKLDESKSAHLTAGCFAEAPAQMNRFAWTKAGGRAGLG